MVLEKDDVIVLGGRREAMAEKMGLVGTEVSDRGALDVPLDHADILVTNREMLRIGFPVAYAVSGILLTVFGSFATVLAQ